MRKMSNVINIIGEENVKWGILISAIITTTFYVIISIISMIVGEIIFSGFYLVADLEFLVGSIFGVVFFFKNREPNQDFLKYGIIVGIFGGILSCVFISIYQTMLVLITVSGPVTVFFFYFILTILSGAIIGLLTGAFLALYYSYKDEKGDTEEKELLDDKFFNDLIDK